MFIVYMTKEMFLDYKILLTGRKSVYGGEERLKNVKYRVAPHFQGIY